MNDDASVLELYRDISENIDDILEIKKYIKKYGEELGCVWKGSDERLLENAIEQLVYKLDRVILELDELNHDILTHQVN